MKHALLAFKDLPRWARNASLLLLVFVAYLVSLALYQWGWHGWDGAHYIRMAGLATMIVGVIAVPCVLLGLGSRWRDYADRRKRVAGKCATASGILWFVGLAALMLLDLWRG